VDGVLLVNGVFSFDVKRDREKLKVAINQSMKAAEVSHIMPKETKNGTTLWVSLTANSSRLNLTLMDDIVRMPEAVRKFAVDNWLTPVYLAEFFDVTKLDSTIDLAGSFGPCIDEWVFECIREKIQIVIAEMLMRQEFKFFDVQSPENPTVRAGDNCLDTCYQFGVHDNTGFKFMNIKLYNKLIETVGRTSFFQVGSELREVIGSCLHIDDFNKKFRKTRDCGLTRVEVSVFFKQTSPYQFNLPCMKSLLKQNILTLLSKLTKQVLNDPMILPAVYR
jgi:hypothetical protein